MTNHMPDMAAILEKQRIKVNSKGKKRRKRVCPNGMKANSAGTGCEPIKSKEKQTRKIASRKAKRTVKAKGSSAQKAKNRKTKKAMRFRKSLGV